MAVTPVSVKRAASPKSEHVSNGRAGVAAVCDTLFRRSSQFELEAGSAGEVIMRSVSHLQSADGKQ